MGYPKNDPDYEDGFVTFVKDDGHEKIIVGYYMPNWGLPGGYRGSGLQSRPDFTIKVGMRIRIYNFQGVPQRGVYIAGRIILPYLTKEQGKEKIRKVSERRWNRMYEQDLATHESVSTK